MQMTCRDRNRLAMQADILGAHTLGIKNILCLTGDHMSFGNHPEAKGVHDLDSHQPHQDVQGHARREEVPVRRGDARRAAGSTSAAPRTPSATRSSSAPCASRRRSRPAPTSCRPSASSTSPSSRSGWRRSAPWACTRRSRSSPASRRSRASAARATCRSSCPAWTCRRRSSTAWPPCEKGAPSQAEGKKLAVEMIKELAEIEGVAGVHIMAVEWEPAVPEIVEAAGLLPRPAVA